MLELHLAEPERAVWCPGRGRTVLSVRLHLRIELLGLDGELGDDLGDLCARGAGSQLVWKAPEMFDR